MRTINPAYDEAEARKKRESVELCGKNRGPHDYMPIEWVRVESAERVTRLMCRVCFCNVSTATLLLNYPEVNF